MDTSPSYQAFASAEKFEPGGGRSGFADPWAEPESGQDRRDSWMLSYIDILTLLLTLFVLLLVLQPKYKSPATDGSPELASLAYLTTIEPQPAIAQQEATVEEATVEEATVEEAAVEEAMREAERFEIGPVPAVSSVAGADPVKLVVEPETLIQMSRAAPLLVSALSPPGKPTPEVEAVETAADTPDVLVSEPSQQQQKRTATPPLIAVMAKLAERNLDKRLEVSQKAEGVHLEVRDNILFAAGSAQLKPEGRQLLEDLAEVLLQHQGRIAIEGHTDNRAISSERFPSNWELSSGRATTVTRYLVEHGLNAARLRAVGYADTRPLERNDTTAGRARNRRVSLIVEFPRSR